MSIASTETYVSSRVAAPFEGPRASTEFVLVCRWYGQEGAVRARARGCVAGGGGAPDNCKHLAALLLRHMLASCLPGGDGLSQVGGCDRAVIRRPCVLYC